jgi:L-aspartate oxidase
MCGGVRTDEMGRTSINRTLRRAENAPARACTAPTAWRQQLACSKRSCSASAPYLRRYHRRELTSRIPGKRPSPDWDASGTTDPEEMVLITQSMKELKEIMS